MSSSSSNRGGTAAGANKRGRNQPSPIPAPPSASKRRRVEEGKARAKEWADAEKTRKLEKTARLAAAEQQQQAAAAAAVPIRSSAPPPTSSTSSSKKQRVEEGKARAKAWAEQEKVRQQRVKATRAAAGSSSTGQVGTSSLPPARSTAAAAPRVVQRPTTATKAPTVRAGTNGGGGDTGTALQQPVTVSFSAASEEDEGAAAIASILTGNSRRAGGAGVAENGDAAGNDDGPMPAAATRRPMLKRRILLVGAAVMLVTAAASIYVFQNDAVAAPNRIVSTMGETYGSFKTRIVSTSSDMLTMFSDKFGTLFGGSSDEEEQDGGTLNGGGGAAGGTDNKDENVVGRRSETLQGADAPKVSHREENKVGGGEQRKEKEAVENAPTRKEKEKKEPVVVKEEEPSVVEDGSSIVDDDEREEETREGDAASEDSEDREEDEDEVAVEGEEETLDDVDSEDEEEDDEPMGVEEDDDEEETPDEASARRDDKEEERRTGAAAATAAAAAADESAGKVMEQQGRRSGEGGRTTDVHRQVEDTSGGAVKPDVEKGVDTKGSDESSSDDLQQREQNLPASNRIVERESESVHKEEAVAAGGRQEKGGDTISGKRKDENGAGSTSSPNDGTGSQGKNVDDSNVELGSESEADKKGKVEKDEDVSGSTTAHLAAAAGDAHALLSLVEIASTNPDMLHARDNNGFQPIHEAAINGRADVIEFLLDHGANINDRTAGGDGGTPLYWALTRFSDEDDVVVYLESRGALYVEPDSDDGGDEEDDSFDENFVTGGTRAHEALDEDDMDALLEIASSDPDMLHSKDENGYQPIHEAAINGQPEIVQLLVAHGANINERTNFGAGGTPLYWAVTTHGDDHPVVEYLKGRGGLDIGPDEDDDEPGAAKGPTRAHLAVMEGDLDTLRDIAVSEPRLLHAKDDNGFQPIHEGAMRGRTEVVRLLVEHGANIDERTHDGTGGTPLYWAQQALGQDHPVVTYLRSKGAEYREPE